MTRVVRNAALLALGGILLASAAVASVPDPSKCILGSNYGNGTVIRPYGNGWARYIPVVGFITSPDYLPDKQDSNAAKNMYGDYEVTVKDNSGVLIAGATVCIDFSNCPDVIISGNQLVTKSPN